jgi:hypothetical protein
MKKKSATGKRGGKRSAKDLTTRRGQNPKGGQLASSVQKKYSDTANAIISKMG